jgi:predicted nucleic acid-binding protein
MNIKEKIIIVDTNIISDLYEAGVLDKFINLENIYMSKLVKYNEINGKTGDLYLIDRINTITESENQILQALELSTNERGLSIYDCINFVLARDEETLLLTGDRRLRNYAEKQGVTVKGTIWIIDKMIEENQIDRCTAKKAYERLLYHENTRLPSEELQKRIKKLEEELITS